ncbi:MAG: hypothetical protein JNL19_11450 [Burkholderiales bacterium]|nr:hypothetical protein [Burkholderiales bacterium]
MKRMATIWGAQSAGNDIVRATLAVNATPVGTRRAGDGPYDIADVLLVKFYLHRVGVMAGEVAMLKPLYSKYTALAFPFEKLRTEDNDALLRDRIAKFQQLETRLAVDGRMSVVPGRELILTYADASSQYGGARFYTMSSLVNRWQHLTELTGASRQLSKQQGCPVRLQDALRALH